MEINMYFLIAFCWSLLWTIHPCIQFLYFFNQNSVLTFKMSDLMYAGLLIWVILLIFFPLDRTGRCENIKLHIELKATQNSTHMSHNSHNIWYTMKRVFLPILGCVCHHRQLRSGLDWSLYCHAVLDQHHYSKETPDTCKNM